LKTGEVASRELLEEMASQMAHRGPDAQGVFLHENLGFGHRRLKIIDLSESADQPIFNEDGRVGVVFNGEIYNFLELRDELEKLGHRFQTCSDTEVIVHAYEEWKEDAFSKFDGIFAFALWDLRERAPVVYLARDRVGAKPLFYCAKMGRLAFASELKPLLKISWIGRDLDPTAMMAVLKHSHVSQPMSIFREIKQVSPGSFLKIRAQEMLENRFWDPLKLYRQDTGNERSESDWLEELNQVFSRTVKKQLVSDVPVGVFLSGGVDSSLIVTALRDATSAPLKTFCIGYHEGEFDESSSARALGHALGTDHHELIVSPSDFYDLIPDIPHYFDQPMADPTLLSTLLLCRFARKEVGVVLSGDGGDELFYGYSYQQALFHLQVLKKLPSMPRQLSMRWMEALFAWIARFPGPSSLNLWAQRFSKTASILQFQDEAELFQYFIGNIGPMRMDRIGDLLVESGRSQLHAQYLSILNNLDGLPWCERISQVFFRTFLPDTVLAKTDRASMAFGLEARVPFLGNEMLEFSARLPFRFKYQKGCKKYLPRKLLASKLATGSRSSSLAEELSKRPKQGFSIPLREWLRGDLKYLLDEYLNHPRVAREGVFVPQLVDRIVSEHLQRHANHSHLLWSLVVFQMWKERYLS
jgi:asparagine synthase (glutamine-hydrolysing)